MKNLSSGIGRSSEAKKSPGAWTLITVLDISTVLLEKGLYDEALSGHRRASKVYENLGKDHPLTITTVHDMAMVLSGKDVTRMHWNGTREH